MEIIEIKKDRSMPLFDMYLADLCMCIWYVDLLFVMCRRPAGNW